MQKITIPEYLIKMMQVVLTGDVVVETACEHYTWPRDEDGNEVKDVPAGRFEFYICARLPETPSGLDDAKTLPIETLLREHHPELFLSKLRMSSER